MRRVLLLAVLLAAAGPVLALDEARNLRLVKSESGAELAWDAVPGATTYRVYRCDLGNLRTKAMYGVCAAEGLTPPLRWTDPDTGSLFYLVTGNDASGDGPLGTDSSGNPRTNYLPCDFPAPKTTGTATVTVRIANGRAISGFTLVVTWNPWLYDFGTADPTGIATGSLCIPNPVTGSLRFSCITTFPFDGPGDVALLTFPYAGCIAEQRDFGLSCSFVDQNGWPIPGIACSLTMVP